MASMKEVSHFNLGTALELMLKAILLSEGTDPEKSHRLTVLYKSLKTESQDRLNSTFDEIFKNKPMQWVCPLCR